MQKNWKPFLGLVLTGILVNEGILDWDDKVKQYLPDFSLNDSVNANNLTIRHILSHTTGLPKHTFTNLLDCNVPYHEIVNMLELLQNWLIAKGFTVDMA